MKLPDGWAPDGHDGGKGPCPVCSSSSGRSAWMRRYGSRLAAGHGCGATTRAILAALSAQGWRSGDSPAGVGVLHAGQPGTRTDDPRGSVARLRRQVAPLDAPLPASVAQASWTVAGEIAAGVPAETLPGHACRYLASRAGPWPAGRAWPVRCLLPGDLLRLERMHGGSWWSPVGPFLPFLAGVVVYPFTAAGETSPGAVQWEAFDHQNARLLILQERKRHTIGRTTARAFRVPALSAPDGIGLVEGPTTAVAVAADFPRVEVWALGGPLGLATVPHVLAGLRAARLPVRVFGEAGARLPAVELTQRLQALGINARAPWLPPAGSPDGFDFADHRLRGCR